MTAQSTFLFQRGNIGLLYNIFRNLQLVLKFLLLQKFVETSITEFNLSIGISQLNFRKKIDLVKQIEEVIEPYRANKPELSVIENLKKLFLAKVLHISPAQVYTATLFNSKATCGHITETSFHY